MTSFLETHKPATISHWIASNRGPQSLHNWGRDDPVPETADYVIVGAGISGALLAYHLAHPGDASSGVPEGSRIVILEGSEVSSSATGRNGGHFAPATFMSYPRLVKPFSQGGCGLSPSQAVNILLHEWDNFARNKAVIKKHNLEQKVDLWEGNITTVYTDKEKFKAALGILDDWKAALRAEGHDDYSGNVIYEDEQEAAKFSRVRGAIGCTTRNGGSVHPHKLTTELLKLSLASETYQVSLHTSTPVLDILDTSGGSKVKTNRGIITAPKVILCTNAHTPHLFPSDHPFHDFFYPVRIQMGLFTPPSDFTGTKHLSTSYGFPEGYMATSAGGIVVGIGASDMITAGVGKEEYYLGNSDISRIEDECTEHLKGFMKRTFVGWEEEAYGEGLTRTWTGVMSYTADRLPLIGPVPGRPGLYMSAGYNGHGMSTTHTCNRGLARFLASENWDVDFPTPYVATEERLTRKVPNGDLYEHVMGMRKASLPGMTA